MEWICMKNQDNIQWQEQGSRYQIENWNLQTRKEAHSRLHNKVWSISHEGGYKWVACHILIEEKCMNRYYQDNIRISTNGSIWDLERIESGNYISRIRI